MGLAQGDGDRAAVAITGVAAVSAYGRGTQALLSGVLSGVAAFAPVERFDVSKRRVRVGALLAGAPVLADELAEVLEQAGREAGLTSAQRSGCPLLLAVHGDPDAARADPHDAPAHATGEFAARIARRAGLASARAYTSACVAASTATADAAAMIALGQADRVMVAAGYLVDADQFALFDAGRALASDGVVRPFSAGRKGLLLGDGVAAMVLESAAAAAHRHAQPLAWLSGWGRAGDAHHVSQPHPDGVGLARAIAAALRRAGICAQDVEYINAHGSGSPQSDSAEANALRRSLGPAATTTPVSSTKSLHGQALEASPLLELIVTVLAAARGQLPATAGFLGPDEQCPLNLILAQPLAARPRYSLSLNSAFGGANTALLVGLA